MCPPRRRHFSRHRYPYPSNYSLLVNQIQSCILCTIVRRLIR